jgi:hypothetical protein|tara:strand:+ start:2698 stop:3765 length:1068 start_codon:yes stop_codon:yes gene_type:complete
MYFREFGIPARIARCFNVEQLEKKIAEFNGKKNCYTSVYVFDDTSDKTESKTNYDSAVLNTIWFDFDDEKDVKKCLMDVRRFIRQYCKPNGIIPRIYLTGGKGFQMNIDLYSHVDLSDTLKRDMLRNYLTFLKKKYKLKTLDQACINNSVACLRRIPNTKYISKITQEPTGVWCIQLTVDEVMKMSIEEIYGMAVEPREEKIDSNKSKKAFRHFVEYICDEMEVKHNVSLSIAYLLDKINNNISPIKHTSIQHDYIMPPRKCIIELIELNIERGHSSHEENKMIGMELINAGYSNCDIHFVFESIYNEPGRDWGWYTDNPDKAGHIIHNMREKALNRYSKDKLIQMNICKDNCPC